MKKDLGVIPAVFPLPVLMIGTYDKDGVPDVMNAAWGTVCDMDKIALCLGAHKTTENIAQTGAFTVAIADARHVREADYFGITSACKTPDKFARSGLTAVRSKHVNAPIVEVFPLTMECTLLEEVRTDNLHMFVGKIVNVTADDSVLDDRGKVDAAKLGAIAFDQFGRSYRTMGEQIAGAWKAGVPLTETWAK